MLRLDAGDFWVGSGGFGWFQVVSGEFGWFRVVSCFINNAQAKWVSEVTWSRVVTTKWQTLGQKRKGYQFDQA